MQALRLVSLSYSPYSERARWALDHHRLTYELVEHRPVVGELRLRRLLGRNQHGGRVTAPALIVGDEILRDSWDIARYADRHGASLELFPPDRLDELGALHESANVALTAGRVLLLHALLQSDGALDESLPARIPRSVRPLLRPFTRQATRWFARKYACDLNARASATSAMRSVLDGLRAALRASSPFLLGSFSYADIAMATMLQGVSPVADRFIALGTESRSVWTRTSLAHDYDDLVRWRNELYDNCRGAQ